MVGHLLSTKKSVITIISCAKLLRIPASVEEKSLEMRSTVQSYYRCCNESCPEWRRHLNKGQPVSAPRAQRFENKYGSETDAEKRVNSSMEHKKSNKIEREEYNTGPPVGKKVPLAVGLFLQGIGGRVMFAAFTSKVRLIVWSSTSI